MKSKSAIETSVKAKPSSISGVDESRVLARAGEEGRLVRVGLLEVAPGLLVDALVERRQQRVERVLELAHCGVLGLQLLQASRPRPGVWASQNRFDEAQAAVRRPAPRRACAPAPASYSAWSRSPARGAGGGGRLDADLGQEALEERWRSVRRRGWNLTKKTGRAPLELGGRQQRQRRAEQRLGLAAGPRPRSGPRGLLGNRDAEPRLPERPGHQPRLISSRSSFPGLKCGTRLAGTTTPAPVLGLRPVRLSRRRTRKLPKPRSSILSPCLQGADDRGEDGVDDDLGVLAREVRDPRNLVHQLGLGHRPRYSSSLSFAACGRPERVARGSSGRCRPSRGSSARSRWNSSCFTAGSRGRSSAPPR